MLTADIDSPMWRRPIYLMLLTHSRAGIKQGQLELYVHVGRIHPYNPEPCTAFTCTELSGHWRLFVLVYFIHFTGQCYAERGIATASCLSVRPSVTWRYPDHIGWKSSKITSRLDSLEDKRSRRNY